jgi:hypothetical protein
MVAMADLMFIMGTAEWPADIGALYSLFPQGDINLFTKASRWIKDLI